MDERLTIPDQLRRGGQSSLPLYSLAWRYLKSVAIDQENLNKEKIEQAVQRRKALAGLAQEVFLFKRQVAIQPGLQTPNPLSGTIERMQSILDGLDTHIVAPDGEEYTEDLMEILDNLVAQPDPSLDHPQVKETILPTIFCEGELVQRGKAVIGVPQK
jgi:hypothetical protein